MKNNFSKNKKKIRRHLKNNIFLFLILRNKKNIKFSAKQQQNKAKDNNLRAEYTRFSQKINNSLKILEKTL